MFAIYHLLRPLQTFANLGSGQLSCPQNLWPTAKPQVLATYAYGAAHEQLSPPNRFETVVARASCVIHFGQLPDICHILYAEFSIARRSRDILRIVSTSPIIQELPYPHHTAYLDVTGKTADLNRDSKCSLDAYSI